MHATERNFFEKVNPALGNTATGPFNPNYDLPDEKYVNQSGASFGDLNQDKNEHRQREGTPQQYFDANMPSRGAPSTFSRSMLASELDYTKNEPPTHQKRF